MRLLVTGGAGFIGSAVVRSAVAAGHSVVNVDCLTYAANLDNLLSVENSGRHTFRQVDIRDRGALQEVFAAEKPDAVLHLAAESHVDRSIGGPGDFIQTNIVGTFNLLEASRDYWSTLEGTRRDRFRFHHISTDEVYGTLGDSGTFTEESPYRPNSPYSASKAASDQLVRAWHRTYGLPALITNCSNNYGPFQFPEKLIPVVILSALHGQVIPIYGNGRNVRDWLYVDDHADALLTVLEKGRVGETYNIGGDAEVANVDLVDMICTILDAELPASARRPHAQLKRFVTDRPGHDFRYAIDASKIAAELGWRPRHTLEAGLRDTVRWYLANETWWSGAWKRRHAA